MTREELVEAQHKGRAVFLENKPVWVYQLSWPWSPVDVALIKRENHPRAKLERVTFDRLHKVPRKEGAIDV